MRSISLFRFKKYNLALEELPKGKKSIRKNIAKIENWSQWKGRKIGREREKKSSRNANCVYKACSWNRPHLMTSKNRQISNFFFVCFHNRTTVYKSLQISMVPTFCFSFYFFPHQILFLPLVYVMCFSLAIVCFSWVSNFPPCARGPNNQWFQFSKYALIY